MGQFGSYGTENGQFSYPMGIAVDGSGYVYVVDLYNYRVQVFYDSSLFPVPETPFGTTLFAIFAGALAFAAAKKKIVKIQH
jgi:DNA-binding beta-propeller fold protein YncE